MTDNIITGPNFSEMTIQQLRQYASHMQIPIAKTADKQEIIKALNAKIKDRSVPELAQEGSVLKPGYARIKILEDSTPGAENYPVYLQCNGYQCTIPRGREVIVPMRVLRTLQDAKVKRRKQIWMADPSLSGREVMRETVVEAPSYPYQVLDINHGPEPLTATEAAKVRVMAPRKRYRDMFGHYPRRGELKRAIEQGFISLNPETEQLSEAEENVSFIQE